MYKIEADAVLSQAPEGPKSLQLVRVQNEIDWVREIKTGCVILRCGLSVIRKS